MDENQVIEPTQEIGVDIGSTVMQSEETESVAVSGTSSDVELDAGQEKVVDVEAMETVSKETVSVAEVDSYDGEYDINHALINNRDASDQHPISSITGLKNRLENIEAVKRVYSSENGLSEFRKWDDGNPDMVNRAGYFVKLVQGTDNIAICTDEDDVYGITVINSGFVGGQVEFDKSDDPSYSIVGIAGALRVRTDGTARDGEYVVPNALGEATFSENNCGYKVISQGSYESYPYVTIAVTPQNDKISKIYGMLADSDGDSVSNLIVKIEDLEEQVSTNKQTIIHVQSDNESIKDIINENQSSIQEVSNVANTAMTTAQEAKDSISSAVDTANDAAAKARQAALDAENAAADLSSVVELVDVMEPIVEFESGEYKGAAGVVAMATETQMNLGELMETVDKQGNDIASIMMGYEEGDGITIQHLVSHIDKYSVGQYSTSEGLSYDEAQTILTDEYVYACTKDHTEIMSADTSVEFHFERPEGAMYSYLWTPANDETGTAGVWSYYKEVSTATTYADGTNEYDLWYCWQDVEELDQDGNVITTYIPGTLYLWEENSWIAVATVSDNNRSRILSSIKQTADGLQSEVVDARGNFSSLSQNLDSMNSIIGDVQGNVSAIQQDVDDITLTISNINGTLAGLQQHADETDASLTMVSSGRFHVVYQSYMGTPPDVYNNGNKYSLMPTWYDEQEEFVFDENFVDNTDGIYYFHSVDKTKYCKIVDGGYEIYTIGNKATSVLDSRITNTEAILTGTAALDTEESSALANVTVKADENGSSVASIASYYYHSLISIEKEQPTLYGTYEYIKPPVWNVGQGKYVFDINDRLTDGVIYAYRYFLIDESAQTYCKVVTTGGEEPKTLYEIYGLGGTSNAMIVQEVTENRSTIGMIAENGEVKGSLIIEAINGDESTAKLKADKIHLTGTDEISLKIDNAVQGKLNSVVLTASSQIFVKAAGSETYEPLTITLTAETSGDLESYTWYCNDTLISNATSNILIISPNDFTTNSATYKVVGTDEDGLTYTDSMTIAKLSSGSDGVSYYTWIKYADTPTSGMADKPEGKSYMGIAYNQTAITESTDYDDYEWSLIKGEDGIGIDGTTYYTWIKYADDASGTNMSDSPDGKEYIGIAYNQESAAESNSATDYTWALFKGSDGINGQDGTTYYTWIKYADTPTSGMSDTPDGKTYMGLAYNKTSKDESSNYEDYQWSLIKGEDGIGVDGTTYYTWVKYADDENGTNMSDNPTGKAYIGIAYNKETQEESSIATDYAWALFRGEDGVDGNDGYTVLLGNQYIEVPVNENKCPLEDKTYICSVTVYKGTKELTATKDTPSANSTFKITSCSLGSIGQGITPSVNSSAPYKVQMQVSKNTAIADINNIDIIISVGESVVLTSKIVVSANMNDVKADANNIISIINVGKEDILIQAAKVNLNGYVTVTSLQNGGTTVIDGSRITTGVIKSSGYSYTDGNTYSTTGTSFDLSNGVIRSQNFAINSDGSAYFKGNIDAKSGTIGGFTIGATSLYNKKSTLLSEETGVYIGTDGISLGANFFVTNTGYLIAKSAAFTGTLTTTLTDGYKTKIDGNKMQFYNTNDVLVGQMYATTFSTSGYTSIWANQLHLWASTNVETDTEDVPQIDLYGSCIELWGSDGETGIRINMNDNNTIQLYGTVLINDSPITATFA